MKAHQSERFRRLSPAQKRNALMASFERYPLGEGIIAEKIDRQTRDSFPEGDVQDDLGNVLRREGITSVRELKDKISSEGTDFLTSE